MPAVLDGFFKSQKTRSDKHVWKYVSKNPAVKQLQDCLTILRSVEKAAAADLEDLLFHRYKITSVEAANHFAFRRKLADTKTSELRDLIDRKAWRIVGKYMMIARQRQIETATRSKHPQVRKDALPPKSATLLFEAGLPRPLSTGCQIIVCCPDGLESLLSKSVLTSATVPGLDVSIKDARESANDWLDKRWLGDWTRVRGDMHPYGQVVVFSDARPIAARSSSMSNGAHTLLERLRNPCRIKKLACLIVMPGVSGDMAKVMAGRVGEKSAFYTLEKVERHEYMFRDATGLPAGTITLKK